MTLDNSKNKNKWKKKNKWGKAVFCEIKLPNFAFACLQNCK